LHFNDEFKIITSHLKWLVIILRERYGHDFLLKMDNGALSLQLPGATGMIVFDRLDNNFYKIGADLGFSSWDSESEGWNSVVDSMLPAPGSVSLQSPLIEQRNDNYVIHYDIMGLTYWMLTRIEEVQRKDLDKHQRFLATSSHAFRCGYLERPVVDEWLHILGQVIERQWPSVHINKHEFSMAVSHDVDRLSRYAQATPINLFQRMVIDITRGRELSTVFMAPWIRSKSLHRLHEMDPFNTYDWIMDQSEQHGLQSVFNFISGRTNIKMDGDYDIEHPAVRSLMRRINARGHQIGLHPSYETYQNSDLFITEAERLRRVLSEEGIEQQVLGGRMHYLRWEHPTTLYHWQAAGMAYDSTLGYADLPGFRCGTCFDFPAFDPVAGVMMKLRIQPLIVMDTSVMAKHYLGLGVSEVAYNKFASLKSVCKLVGGSFSVLWHNSNLATKMEKGMYKALLSY
jgi:hypothetical protein